MRHLITAVAALSACATVPAFADTLKVGTYTGGNGAPFSGRLSTRNVGTTYQQIYTSSIFTGPVQIQGLTFYNSVTDYNGLIEANHVAGGTFTVSLSTTSRSLNGLSLTDFASNLGSNNKQVFSGTLSNQTFGTPGSFTIDFGGTTFDYDPTQGNLLLDIRYNGRTTTDYVVLQLDATNGGSTVYSRASNFVGQTDDINDGYGLVTGFTFRSLAGAVPEPGSWMLMIAGFGAMGVAMRRRRVSLRFA